jgi:hypothetical protein
MFYWGRPYRNACVFFAKHFRRMSLYLKHQYLTRTSRKQILDTTEVKNLFPCKSV